MSKLAAAQLQSSVGPLREFIRSIDRTEARLEAFVDALARLIGETNAVDDLASRPRHVAALPDAQEGHIGQDRSLLGVEEAKEAAPHRLAEDLTEDTMPTRDIAQGNALARIPVSINVAVELADEPTSHEHGIHSGCIFQADMDPIGPVERPVPDAADRMAAVLGNQVGVTGTFSRAVDRLVDEAAHQAAVDRRYLPNSGRLPGLERDRSVPRRRVELVIRGCFRGHDVAA